MPLCIYPVRRLTFDPLGEYDNWVGDNYTEVFAAYSQSSSVISEHFVILINKIIILFEKYIY